MDFTKSQSKAILWRGSSVLVSAGAGSGKTRVLTERLMEYIDPKESKSTPVEIDSFLIITFTRAAASELRGRIASAITDRLKEKPDNTHLRRQLMKCRNAEIGTIHSFCANTLRDHASQAGISPTFRILEEERSERLRMDALEKILEKHYNAGGERFLQLVDTVGVGRDDSRLAEQILKIHTAIQSHADPNAWIEEQLSLLKLQHTDFGNTPWGKELLALCEETVAFWSSELEECLEAMRESEKVYAAYGESFSATVSALKKITDAVPGGWDAVSSCFPVPFPNLKALRNDPLPEFTGSLKKRRDSCKKAMTKLQSSFSENSDSLLSQLNGTVPLMTELLSLTLDLEREFQSSKRRINSLDFSDLEHRTLALLRTREGQTTELAKELSERYTEIMVDEYQDVSRVQDLLFYAISREGNNLFFVGDVKQSIYRFRLADPTIFTEKAAMFEMGMHSEKSAPYSGALIRLRENFRSRKEVLNAVNSVFLRCMTRELGDLDYNTDEALIAGAEFPDSVPNPELILIDRAETENGALEAEANEISVRIHKMMKTVMVRENGNSRPLRFGDIAILLRAANTVGGTFRRVLQKNGIPVASGAAGEFYASTEISTVFSMLSVMDNPYQDIPLLALLRSPCLNFSADQLSSIRALSPDENYFMALSKSKDGKAEAFLSMLKELRAEAPDRNPSDLVERIIEELDLYAVCSAMPDGDKRIQRLSDLLAMAETFRNSDEHGLHRFVLWLRNMERRGNEPSSGAESGNAVQILSIHKSKGLEFPIVFYSGLGREFNRGDTRGTVLVHSELGLGPAVTDPLRKVEYPSAARRAIEARISRESLSEEMRLMYVAMTRAKERLILTACRKNPEKALEQAAVLVRPLKQETKESGSIHKIPATLLSDASCPLQWILPAVVEGHAISFSDNADGNRESELADVDYSELETKANPELEEAIHRNLTWEYPFRQAEHLPSKVTPTELKGRADFDPDAFLTGPAADSDVLITLPDLNTCSASAAKRGSAVHLLLQHIDFSKTNNLNDIMGEIQRLQDQEFLSEEDARSVNPDLILRFFASDLGRRIKNADRCWREFRFSLMIEADRIIPSAPHEERILLQGAVDCFFKEQGKLILIDYKTDRIDNRNMLNQKRDFYRGQLDTYALALQRIFRCPVAEKHLVFLLAEQQIIL